MNDACISVSGVSKQFGNAQVLRGVDLVVPRGSVVGLLGTNGAGKTTLIKCILGLLRVNDGQCQVVGEDAWSLSPQAKARIGYVPQVISFFPWMRVRDLVRYTASFYPRWSDDLCQRLIRDWDIPSDQRCGTLSVGQTQKLAIMLAVGHEPDVLVLDEPAAALDPLARRQFLQLIIDLAAPGQRTILFSTHLTTDLERVADRVAVLKSGRVSWSGLLEDLKEQTHLNLEESFLEMHHA
jgi:ABC-2 type transport system ATP-binding protein